MNLFIVYDSILTQNPPLVTKLWSTMKSIVGIPLVAKASVWIKKELLELSPSQFTVFCDDRLVAPVFELSTPFW